ncbi:alpha/beta fold hydrolase [Paenibacillus hubeiensis]|uniref:alpha/beta fold hydrolase n=1 Tax=Paenibacillus hubeiensis TaxID=3077330 RepID=UPI0031BA8A61
MNTIISRDGTNIAYDKMGQGPALILVAGAFSYRKFPGQVQLAKELSDQFTVYNYDRRGRGDSGDGERYAIEREIQDLEALIEEAGGKAYVWGLSSGAVLAMKAAENGAKITKLALHEPPFIVNASDRTPPVDFLDQVARLIAEEKRAEAIKYFMTQGMGAPAFVVSMMRMMPGVWANLMSVAHTLPYDAQLMQGYMSGKSLPAHFGKKITQPSLVLEGIESPSALRSGAHALASILPNGELRSKKGLGHTKKLNAKRIASELKAFFDQDSDVVSTVQER